MHPISQEASAHPLKPEIAAQANSSEIDEFIYLISHDVRASVRALLELPQWIKEDLEDADVPITGSVASSLELMDRHMGRLDRMLIDLLTHSRVGRMQEQESLNLTETLDQVLEDMEVPGGFELTRDLVCNTLTMGERDLLTLLRALIRNAMKHHDKPNGRIHVSSNQDSRGFYLRVSDDGPGISVEHHDRVFGAMRTLRPRDEVEGSGMGLTTVRKIAEFYGGTAEVGVPVFSRGVTIEVRIPFTDSSKAA